MKRRKFVTLGAATLGALPVMGLGSFGNFNNEAPPVRPAWLIELIHLNDKNIEPLKSRQVTDATSKNFGGLWDGDEITSPQTTVGFIAVAAPALSWGINC